MIGNMIAVSMTGHDLMTNMHNARTYDQEVLAHQRQP